MRGSLLCFQKKSKEIGVLVAHHSLIDLKVKAAPFIGTTLSIKF